jgi:hypothetical protein
MGLRLLMRSHCRALFDCNAILAPNTEIIMYYKLHCGSCPSRNTLLCPHDTRYSSSANRTLGIGSVLTTCYNTFQMACRCTSYCLGSWGCKSHLCLDLRVSGHSSHYSSSLAHCDLPSLHTIRKYYSIFQTNCCHKSNHSGLCHNYRQDIATLHLAYNFPRHKIRGPHSASVDPQVPKVEQHLPNVVPSHVAKSESDPQFPFCEIGGTNT